jgi:hypothetical protein
MSSIEETRKMFYEKQKSLYEEKKKLEEGLQHSKNHPVNEPMSRASFRMRKLSEYYTSNDGAPEDMKSFNASLQIEYDNYCQEFNNYIFEKTDLTMRYGIIVWQIKSDQMDFDLATK